MKIGISCYPTYGGSGVVATELGIQLAMRGHEVHFLSYRVPMRLDIFQANVYFHAVEVPTYPLFEYPPYSLALAAKMADVAVHRGLDLIHVHYAVPHAASAYLAKQMLEDRPLKVVTTLHGTDITLVGNDRSFLPITRFSIEKSDAVTAVSTYLAKRTYKELGVTKPIEVIPNFIDLERFRRQPSDIRKCLAKADEKVLMHVSNFRPVKRVGDVVAVFARVAREIKSRLVFVGDGPECAKAEEKCRELGIEDRVLFLGEQADLPHLLSAADLFLLTSESESFGLAALEAMACGVPVVGTLSGGLPEVVEEGVSGFLAPIGDIEGMSRGALRILGDPATAERMAAGARDAAEKRFAAAAVIDRYEALYRRVLS